MPPSGGSTLVRTTLVAALAACCAAAGVVNEQSGDAIRQAIDAGYRQQYDSAQSFIESVLARDSTDPAGPFWQASFIQTLLYDSGERGLVDSFYSVTKQAEELCRQRLSRDERNARAHFYLGMTRLNLANCQSWEQKKSAALRTMLGVQGEMRAALKLDPELTDACFGLGMVEYFRAQGNKFVLGLGLFGSKGKAYDWLRKAEQGSGLLSTSATSSLAWIMGQDRKFDSAIARCEQLLARYPGNRTVMRMMRDIYYSKGDYVKALALGARLEKSIRASFADNKYGLSENWIVSAKCWEGLSQTDSACALAERVMDWEEHQDDVPWLPNYVRDARALLDRHPKMRGGGK